MIQVAYDGQGRTSVFNEIYIYSISLFQKEHFGRQCCLPDARYDDHQIEKGLRYQSVLKAHSIPKLFKFTGKYEIHE